MANSFDMNPKRLRNKTTGQPGIKVEDGSLLAQIVRRDQKAFRELYMRYLPRLRQFILRITHRSDLTEEILNDTFLTIWEKSCDYAGRSKVSTWIFGIAYFKCLKALERSERWCSKHSLVSDQETVKLDFNGPDSTAEAGQLRQRLSGGLMRLSPEQRMVVELTYYFGYSYTEIAAVAKCPVNTVKTRMFHARRKLHEELSSDFYDSVTD